jgi:hypothetical protein
MQCCADARHLNAQRQVGELALHLLDLGAHLVQFLVDFQRFYYGGGVLHDLQVLLLAGAKIPDTRFGVEALPGDIF